MAGSEPIFNSYPVKEDIFIIQKRNEASEVINRNQVQPSELAEPTYVSSTSGIYKKGKQIMIALGKTKGARLIIAILNVIEAGVYSEGRSEAFQIFLAQSSNSPYLSILIFGLMIPMPALLAIRV